MTRDLSEYVLSESFPRKLRAMVEVDLGKRVEAAEEGASHAALDAVEDADLDLGDNVALSVACRPRIPLVPGSAPKGMLRKEPKRQQPIAVLGGDRMGKYSPEMLLRLFYLR